MGAAESKAKWMVRQIQGLRGVFSGLQQAGHGSAELHRPPLIIPVSYSSAYKDDQL